MTPDPTGRVEAAGRGRDLVLTRRFRAAIDDVWASLTDPDRTARWIGRWTGDPTPGRTVRLMLGFEAGAPASDVLVERCDRPHRLEVRMVDDHGGWHLEARLAEHDGVTELTLVHHLVEVADAGSVGPGWEYYLDLLVAARDGTPAPRFEDYYPAQREHYERQAAAVAGRAG